MSSTARYQPVAAAMWRCAVGGDVAAPAWPGSESGDVAAWRTWIEQVWSDSVIADAVTLASPALADTIERIIARQAADPDRLRRAAMSLARYLVRMRRRATPFGLFAGVAPLAFAGGCDRPAWAAQSHARLRVNGDWLAAIIVELESSPDLLRRLHVVANDLGTVRGSRLHISWLPHRQDHDRRRQMGVSLRHTRPAAFVLRTAERPIPVSDLLAKLDAEFPTAATAASESLVMQLVEAGTLITDLPAPLTCVDALGHLLGVLNEVDLTGLPRIRQVTEELSDIHTGIEGSRHTPVGGRTRRVLTDRMRTLSDIPQPLAVDLMMDDAPVVPASVSKAAAAAGTALARLSPAPGGNPSWREYHARFLDRYGAGAFVPVVRLIDEASGLGLPRHFKDRGSPQPAGVSPRDARLLALAQQSALDGAVEVTLTDAELAALAGADGVRVPAHLDITVDVRSASSAALVSGDFTVTVVGVGRSAVATSGRFLDLFPGHDRELLAALPTAVDGALPAQVSFPTYRPSVQIVARVAQLLPTVITVGEHRPERPDLLRLSDLVVLADLDRFYVGSLSRRRIVEPLITCAAAPHTTPPVVRLLVELPNATSAPVSQFSWGVAGCLPFLPRLRHDRAVLSPARWRLPAGRLPDQATPEPRWRDALDALRERLGLPAFVYVGGGDQRLRLDLDDPMDVALFRAHLTRAADPVTIIEAPTDDDYGWCGGRTHEFVVPLVTTAPPTPPPTAAARAAWAPLVGHDHADLPGGSLLFAKLYGPADAVDAIIAEHLPQLWEGWDPPPTWWFVRYRDPRPHLRLRIPTTRYGRDAARLSRWAASLRDLGVAGDLTLDTYRPETARYGTGPAMRAAEELFAADSAAAAAQIAGTDGQSAQAEALAAASLVVLLAALLGGAEPAIRWLLQHPDLHPRTANPDRTLPRRAFDLAGLADDRPALADVPGGPRITAAWQRRTQAAQLYTRCLHEHRAGPTPEAAAVSLLHLHHNRALGSDPDREARVYHLARSVALAHTARGNYSRGGSA